MVTGQILNKGLLLVPLKLSLFLPRDTIFLFQQYIFHRIMILLNKMYNRIVISSNVQIHATLLLIFVVHLLFVRCCYF